MQDLIYILQQQSFWGNTLYTYCIALLRVLWSYGIFWGIRKKLCTMWAQRATTTATRVDDILITAIQHIPSSAGWVLAIYLGIHKLNASTSVVQVTDILFVSIFISQLGLMLVRMIRGFMEQLPHHEENPQTTMLIATIAKIVVRVTVILLILNNLWVQITPLITSLWVIGIATWLALQNVLEDLFSSISIYLDKPFRVWDFIEIWSESWTVKSVGLKTTRLDTIQGEEIVLTNRKLTNETLRNYGVMKDRTVRDSVTLDIATEVELVHNFGDIIRGVMKDIKIIEFKRCLLDKIDNQWYHIEFRYTIKSKDYLTYRQLHEKVMLDISRYLVANNIQRGVPRQSVHRF